MGWIYADVIHVADEYHVQIRERGVATPPTQPTKSHGTLESDNEEATPHSTFNHETTALHPQYTNTLKENLDEARTKRLMRMGGHT